MLRPRQFRIRKYVVLKQVEQHVRGLPGLISKLKQSDTQPYFTKLIAAQIRFWAFLKLIFIPIMRHRLEDAFQSRHGTKIFVYDLSFKTDFGKFWPPNWWEVFIRRIILKHLIYFIVDLYQIVVNMLKICLILDIKIDFHIFLIIFEHFPRSVHGVFNVSRKNRIFFIETSNFHKFL